LRRIHRTIYICPGGKRKAANDVLIVGGVDVVKHCPRLTLDPLAADVVVVGFYRSAC
jgi:hypothetical protein